jgi:hypothetical protein
VKMIETDGMLIPQYSIRGLMVLTAIVGAMSWVVVRGLRGHLLAIAVTGMLAVLAIMAIIAAATFFLAWGYHTLSAQWSSIRRRKQ